MYEEATNRRPEPNAGPKAVKTPLENVKDVMLLANEVMGRALRLRDELCGEARNNDEEIVKSPVWGGVIGHLNNDAEALRDRARQANLAMQQLEAALRC